MQVTDSTSCQFRVCIFIAIVLFLLGVGYTNIAHASRLSPSRQAQSHTASSTKIGETTPAKLAAGNDHTCALTTVGAVQCWGDNADGQVGDGSDFPSRPPVDVVGLAANIIDIATGGNHSCALRNNGTMHCWGRNSQGQLGDGTTNERLVPVAVVGLPAGATAITAGESHTCARFANGNLACWGRNDRGQLGNGTNTEQRTPTLVTDLAALTVEVVAGFGHTCARLVDGNVQCWGDNSQGQLGNGTQSNSNTPVTVIGLSHQAIALAAGFYHTCAVLADGDVECWGDNVRGQLGDGTRDDRDQPVAVQALSDDIASLAAGRYHTCGLAIDGDVHCWGSSNRGQLGNGSLESSRTPLRVRALGEDATAIVAGEEHTCAIPASGGVRCWGSNRDRQLGEGSPGLYSVPQLLIPNRTAGATAAINGIPLIVPGRYHTCMLTMQRGVQCWGRNSDGQVGDGSTIPRSTPVDVVGLEGGIVAVALGAEHSCALRQAGTVACWGSNQHGQLGDGSTEKRTSPVAVNGITGGVAAIATGANHTCALVQGGAVKCWGENSAGQLGDGTTVSTSFPVDVIGLSGATALAAGTAHTCALASSGVQCWGENTNGQLGDGTTTNRSTPGPVSDLPSGTVAVLATGDRHTCVAVNGDVYCWGDNRDGQLGNGTQVDQSTLVAVQGVVGSVRLLSAGASHSCGLTTGNALYCWGGNEQSQLGDGTTADRSTAAVVDGLAANVLALQSGGFHNCALVTGNRPLCWGSDSDGQLATGVLAQSAVPLALGSAPPPTIDVNTVIGQPGSTFTLIGRGFAYSDTLPVVINGTALTATIPANPSGEFIVYVTTMNAEAGAYTLHVGSDPPVALTLLLQPLSALWRPEGGGATLALANGIGRELSTLYLPVVARSGVFSR